MLKQIALAMFCMVLQAWTAAQASESRPTPETHWRSETPEVFVEGIRLHYYGGMNQAGADALRQVLSEATDVRELHIASPGGNALASIDIGEQIRARDLAVVVVGRGCVSGCANYVFTPARRRTISPQSLVFWHYACPKNFPDRRGQIKRTLRRQFGTSSFSYSAEEGGQVIEDPVRLRESFERNLDRLVDGQLEFTDAYRSGHDRIFASSGIDDRIICLTDHMRLPEVPERHISFMYTLSTDDMARLGVCDGDARPDYAAWAQRYIAEDEELPEYAGVVRLSEHPRVRPRPARPCDRTDVPPGSKREGR